MIYGTLVKVVAGFYVGCTGIVIDELNRYSDGPAYMVNLRCEYVQRQTRIVDGFTKTIRSQDLKVLERPKRAAE